MRVFIGVDPHKLSATIEVVDTQETVLAFGRFETNKTGYAAMKKHVAGWPDRVWAVEGSGGAGRPLAQRLLADGERVVDVPPGLSARARLFDTIPEVVQTDLIAGGAADVSQVLVRERAVAVEANPRAISQAANVSSNNPPGMAATSAAPATPDSSSRLPAAKHA
jgi:hypothetical protein